MKKILLLGLFLTLNNVLSQNYIEQVLILNEGYFDYYDTQEIIEPVTIGSYDIETNNYTEIATIEGARFASDLIIDGNNFYVAADNKILKYDLDSYELLDEVEVQGVRHLAINNDKLYVSRGDYDPVTFGPILFDSYFHIYNKNDLSLIEALDNINGPQWSTQNIIIENDLVYVTINNGFEWGNEKGLIGVVSADNDEYLLEIDLGEDGKNPDNLMIKDNFLITVNNKDWSGSSVSRIDLSTVCATCENEANTQNLSELSTGCGTSSIRGDYLNYQISSDTELYKYDFETMETTGIEENISLNFYELIQNPLDGNMYASNTDFFSYGLINIYDDENNLINSFNTGVSPGTIIFDVRSGCNDDDNAAAALANMWNPEISGCEDAIPYLESAGYPCDTDLTVLGMSGTVADICECTCAEEPVETTTVVDIIVGSEDHNTLETAVIAAGLVDALSGEGPFTVFAPTDAAFDALPEGTLDAVLADMDLLTSILTHHVASGSVMSTDLSDGMMVTTLNGTELMVTINDNGVMIDNAMVTVADIMADNGVVHVINAVLIPEDGCENDDSIIESSIWDNTLSTCDGLISYLMQNNNYYRRSMQLGMDMGKWPTLI